MARTVTLCGGCAGGAWIVWNSLVGPDGSDGPTTLLEMMRSLYKVKGVRPVTFSVVAFGAFFSSTLNHDVFLAVWASTVHAVMDELPSKPGVNCSTTEKASMFVTASFVGGFGRTGSIPDWMVATRATPTPT